MELKGFRKKVKKKAKKKFGILEKHRMFAAAKKGIVPVGEVRSKGCFGKEKRD